MHPDALFPSDPKTRVIARRLYGTVAGLKLICPHGHADPAWFAENAAFRDPTSLLVTPDHYILRLLYSQGIPLESLGVARRDGAPVETDKRAIWRRLAEHWQLFRATPTRLWLEQTFATLFDVTETLRPESADRIYDQIAERLQQPAYRPRALFERFNIEVLATTDAAHTPLDQHQSLRQDDWPRPGQGRVIPTFRPDAVTDPEADGFVANVTALGALTGEDTTRWRGYLAALAVRRQDFKALGGTATDHGHPTAATADLSESDATRLFEGALRGRLKGAEAERFRAQMLTEMARMSLEDGLVMQLHPGAWRNHNRLVHERFGSDLGGDIPRQTDYVAALKPLLDRFGNDTRLTLIVFTLDETAFSRELAPLAGHYPALRLGPPWWFLDSPEAMTRFRETTTETAGFANTVGFNDDTRAFCSIPARHDVARRIDCAFLARLVAEHRLDEDEAAETAIDLAYRLPKRAYRL